MRRILLEDVNFCRKSTVTKENTARAAMLDEITLEDWYQP